jgi:HEAT repeat protein
LGYGAGERKSMRIPACVRVGFWGFVGFLLCLGALSGSAAADPPKGARNKKATPAVTVDVAALTEKLKSNDPADVQAALGTAKAAGKGARPLAPAIEELLRRGTQAEVAELALAALGEVGTESSAPAILPYARHRNPEIRKKALAALSRTGGAGAPAAVRAALSDPDRGVRGVAASGLGPLKVRDAVPDLFVALDHDVGEAAASIGQLCAPEECDKLTAKLSTSGLDVMTSAFEAILFRPAAEVPEETKIRIVERVRDLRTEEAGKYLRDLASRWPANESPRVRQAIEQAVRATPGGKS